MGLSGATQGRLRGGSGRNLRPNWAQRGRELHTEGGRIPQIYGSYVIYKSFFFARICMFMFSCRFETEMCQNAPNPFQFQFFSGVTVTPRSTPATGGRVCPRPPGGEGRGGEGRERREGERVRRGRGEGREREGGRNGEGGSLRHCRCGG